MILYGIPFIEAKAVKQAAISLLTKMAKKIQVEALAAPETVVAYVKAVLEVGARGLESSIAEQLALVLSSLLFSSNEPAATYHREAMSAALPVLLSALKQAEVLPTYETILTCMNNTLILFSTHAELTKHFIDILAGIEPAILNTLAQFMVLSKSAAENHGEKFASLVPEMTNKISIINVWADMNMEIFERAGKKNPTVGMYFSTSASLANVFLQASQAAVYVGSQQPENLLSSTDNEDFDEQLNIAKGKCLELANMILEHIHSSPSASKIHTMPIYSYCATLCPRAIITLAVICVKDYDKLEQRINEEASSRVIVRLLRLLTDLLEDNNFYNAFSPNKHSIIVDIVLLLLRSSAKEVKSVRTDPQNFVNLALDTCEKQESEVAKTEAAKLLEALCDHIDGCLSFTAIFCCEAIRYALTSGGNPENLQNFPMLSQFKNASIFLMKSQPEQIVETSIMVMADISYLTPKRHDLFAMLEAVLVENYSALFENASVLVRCRLALMIGYYADNLFSSKTDLFVKMIEFLLQGIALEHEEKALSLQCADTLKTAIGDADLVARLDAFINKLLPMLCTMVETIELPAFYEILMTVVSCYANNVDETVIKLLISLVNRVDKEYKELRAKGERNNMTINQCWNVIRAMCEQKAFFPIYLDSIETALLPMFNYLVDLTNIEFDDDMVQVLTALITRRGSVSENMAKVFPYLTNFFDKYGQSFGSLMQTLNTYIIYGKENFSTNKSWIEIIIKMSVSSMFSTKENITLNNTEGAILAQILLQSIGNGVLDPYIPVIVEQVVKRLASPPTADYLSRELYNVILCSICNNAMLTLSKLETLGVTAQVFTGLLENSGKYQATYDVKVLVIGLSNLLIQAAMPPFLLESQAKVLDTIVLTLQIQAAKDAKSLLKSDKKALALDDENEEESSSSEEDEMQDNSDEEDEDGEK